jgi:hypothetical protein
MRGGSHQDDGFHVRELGVVRLRGRLGRVFGVDPRDGDLVEAAIVRAAGWRGRDARAGAEVVAGELIRAAAAAMLTQDVFVAPSPDTMVGELVAAVIEDDEDRSDITLLAEVVVDAIYPTGVLGGREAS